MQKRIAEDGTGGGAQPGASFPPRRIPRHLRYLLLFLALLLILVLVSVKFKLSGDWDGLYVLKGNKGYLLEVKDSVFLGEYDRVLARFEFRPSSDSGTERAVAEKKPHLRYHWVERTGHGFIRSFFPDRTEFLVCFGRYLDDSRLPSQGLFIGGGLPFNEYDRDQPIVNETGMAFFDGTRWLHLWCNVNEAIGPGLDAHIAFAPSAWKFRGSKVIRGSREEMILASAHDVEIEGQTLRIGRYVFYRAEDRYIVLAVKITNTGSGTASYDYIYGDEPWVGDFGSSEGNVGWSRDGLFQFEGRLDPLSNRFAGYWDRGNPACGTAKIFSNIANFIEWGGDFPPTTVYFSNRVGLYAEVDQRVPLCDPQNRVLFLQYGPRIIAPRQTDLIYFVIGMADPGPFGAPPMKPAVSFNPDDYPLLRRGAANVFAVE